MSTQCSEIEITEEVLVRAARELARSGALAQPEFGVAVLAERVLRAGLGLQTANSPPSKIAVRLDQRL